MFGVMAEPPTTSKPTVRRARPVHSCLDCRNRKLKCDRARPCGQCTKAGRAGECHYDSTAGSMSRNSDVNGEEPSSKRRRSENDDTNDVTSAPGNLASYASSTASQNQYGTYGVGGIPGASPRGPDDHSLMAMQPGESEPTNPYPVGAAQRVPEVTNANQHTAPTLRQQDKIGVVEDLQSRVLRLEKALKLDPGTRDDEESQTTKTGAAEVLVDLRRSHSSAMNPKRSIIHQFEDMRAFYVKTIESSNGMDEIHRLRTVFPKSKQPSRKYLDSNAAMSTIIEMIPRSGDCDRLVKIYLNTWDPVFQILDLSNFLNDYSKFWRQTKEEHRNAFAPALLLVAAIGSTLDDAGQGQYSNILNDSISYVETWLSDLSNKRQKDLEVLSVHALLIIAMQCAAILPDRIYRMTGSLARSAMLMGLHYDPRILQHKADERHIQHRRRLWTSIVELDLQASLQVGLSPAIRDTDLRTQATVLANDSSHESNGNPCPNNPSTLAQASSSPPLQHALAKTLKTRLITGALTLDVYPTHNFAEMRTQIQVPLSSYSPTFSTLLAELYVRKSTLAITRAQIKAQGHRVMEGCLASVRAAMDVLRHMDELDPALNPSVGSKLPWNLYINLFSHEIYRAALVICLVRKVAAQFPPYTGGIGEYSPQTLIATAETCLHRLLKNLDDPGDHVRDLIALTLALESVRPESQKDDATKVAAMKRGFEFLKQSLYERVPADPQLLGQSSTSPATGSSSGHTPLGDFDFQFLANSFNFDLDFGFNMGDMGAGWSTQQAIDFGVPTAPGTTAAATGMNGVVSNVPVGVQEM